MSKYLLVSKSCVLFNIAVRRKKKPHKVYTTQTASYSSTLAEEFVVLLRKLHTLPVWNGLINQHISINLHAIASFILDHQPSSPGGLKASCCYEDNGFHTLLYRSPGKRNVTNWAQCLQSWL